MTTDELPVDVLTELGRLTWALIKLEDYVDDVCSQIVGISRYEPRWVRRPISKKIESAMQVLETWPPSPVRETASVWLSDANAAMKLRNETLHAMPLVAVKGHTIIPDRLLLGTMARQDRPHSTRPLTVQALSEVREQICAVGARWREVTLAVFEECRSTD